MAQKTKTSFVCSECGYISPKWQGKCPDCGSWNTFSEEIVSATGGNGFIATEDITPIPINKIENITYSRIITGIPELDRVLGGGIVPGSAVLVGGDPGIGKSTLLLQMCKTYAYDGKKILYISGEESKEQIAMRARRLSVDNEDMMVLSATDLDSILAAIENINPGVVIIDSIQTMCANDVASSAGSVAQVKECAARIVRYTKKKGIAVFLVGHVNKEGSIAGPKILEHMVDAVLYFEGEKQLMYRVVRTIKNRFGPTSEIGVFEMVENGLRGVENPSLLFLSGRPENVSGVSVACVMEGSRPILAEIQSLTAPTYFPSPRRVSSGVDYNKLCLIIAVLERRAGINLGHHDAYVNVAGGLKLDDPAADLAVAIAIASGMKDFIVPEDMIAIGEIGLGGEIRPVADIDRRIKEGARIGFKMFMVSDKSKIEYQNSDINIIRVSDVSQAVRIMSVKNNL